MGTIALNSVSTIKKEFEGVNTVCGLSNISYGLPKRHFINRHFLVLALMAGLDAAIIDPTDQKLKSAFFATELILGRDNFCLNYLNAFRAGKIVD
jgi:5-methyltetrahydrofolate--homocysteine methyltransferase